MPISASPDKHLSHYIARTMGLPRLERKKEYKLAKRWKEHEDPDAARQIVESHLRMVAKAAFGTRASGVPLDELIAEGNIAMMQALKHFEPDKGFLFNTYARGWLENAMRECTKKKRHPSAYDRSLHEPLSKADSESGELQDILISKEPNQEEILIEHNEKAVRRKWLRCALEALTERERYVFDKIHLADPPYTLDRIAKDPKFLAFTGKESMTSEGVRKIGVDAFKLVQALMLRAERGEKMVVPAKPEQKKRHISFEGVDTESSAFQTAWEILDSRERRVLAARYLEPVKAPIKNLAGELGITGSYVSVIAFNAFGKLKAAYTAAQEVDGKVVSIRKSRKAAPPAAHAKNLAA